MYDISTWVGPVENRSSEEITLPYRCLDVSVACDWIKSHKEMLLAFSTLVVKQSSEVI